MDIEVFLLVESGDFAFSLHQHCQRRRLDAPDHQLLMIERREQPCTVDPNNPVRLGTGKGGFVEPVILAAVPQMVKALSDCAVFQRADPQAFERLRATGFLVDQPKNQLALAPRIGGADSSVTRLSRIRSRSTLNCFCLSFGISNSHSSGTMGRSLYRHLAKRSS